MMIVWEEAVAVYDRAYDDTLPILKAEHGAILAVAEWARKEALKEAEAVVEAQRLAFVRNGAEKGWEQALDAVIHDLAERDA